MTKAEFGEQFKRLRIAGYRLPVFDGVKVGEVVDEWYGTFGSCSVAEFSYAIEKLKETKTDTWWPATGELWFLVKAYRKEQAIRRSANNVGGQWSMSEEESKEFLAVLRTTRDKILGRMTMPHAEPQVAPDHVLEQEEREWEG
jgi:hypothetical protein